MLAITRRAWLKMATTGGALVVEARLPCFGRTKPQTTDKESVVFMPNQAGEAKAPVAAVYYEDWGLYSRTVGPQVILALYGDGRVIWSADHLKGGSPYRTGNLSQQRVHELLADLDHQGVFYDPVRSKSHVGPDSRFTVIAIAAGTRRLNMCSWHEQFEADPGLVATAAGVEILNGRDRAEVLAAQPKSYRHFRHVWDHMRVALMALIPGDGRDAGALEFRVKRILD